MLPTRLLRALPAAVAVLGLLALLAVAAVPASAARGTLTIRGAGWGHGIGMSQYGAYGMALQGWDHERILRHYYTGTELGTVERGRLVRVLLQSGSQLGFTGADRAGNRRLKPGARYQVRRGASGRIHLLNGRGRRIARAGTPLRISGPGPVVLLGTAANGRRDGAYRGRLAVHADPGGGVYAVNEVGLEDYLRGVVPDESPPSWPLEALKAQAVAARSYAITTSKAGAGWDQYADTRSQVYGGVAAEEPSTDRAIAETAGQVVTYDGVPVTTYFFSTSGGRTEDIENAWPGSAPKPWLKSVEDPYDHLSPRHRWGPIRMSLRQARAKLGGLVKGGFRGIDVVRRGSSPRIVYADVVGTRGRTRVTGPALRTAFGLYDTWARFASITVKVKPAPRPPAGSDAGGMRAPGTASARRARIAGRALGLDGRRVRVQRRNAGRWATVARVRVGKRGGYRAAVGEPGRYRVTGPGAGPVRVRVR